MGLDAFFSYLLTSDGVLGGVSVLASIVIAVLIFRAQNKQAVDTRGLIITQQLLLSDTAKILGQLSEEQVRKGVARLLFKINDDENTRYDIFFPLIPVEKPLGQVAMGDIYGLMTIQQAIGPDRYTLKPQAYVEVEADSMELVTECNRVELERNSIFLCSPQANSALFSWAPPLEVEEGSSQSKIKPKFGGVEIPVWFANETLLRDGSKKKRIWTESTGRVLRQSDADQVYEEAKRHYLSHPDRIFSPSQSEVPDLAILGRLTVEGKKVMIIAGIHQMGTWICSDYISQIIDGRAQQHMQLIESSDDFMCIIGGRFDMAKLSAKYAAPIVGEVYHRKIGAQEWERVGE